MLEALNRLNLALGKCIKSLIEDLKYYRKQHLRHCEETVRILNEIKKVDELQGLTDKEKMETVIQIATYYTDFYEDKIIELSDNDQEADSSKQTLI